MLIFLIGMPGSGKTTLGRELAKSLAVPFVDLDLEIIKREKKSIDRIFEEAGEAYFREVEKEVVQWAAGLEKAVVSTGGGAACFYNNMEVMKQSGVTLYLNVPLPELVRRMRQTAGERPMLKDKNQAELLELLKRKVEERAPFYNQADVSVSGSDISLNDVTTALREKQIIS